MFSAISIAKADAGYQATLRELDDSELPDGDVTVRVSYSGLNYKDALAITGKAPVVRRFPMVPGIDLAGVVEHSDSPSYAPGDRVLVNGWGIGETHWGGLAGLARVSGDWLVRRPDGLDAAQAMAIGTAGYTAMLSVLALERHGITAGDGTILVTGASGGVGSVVAVVVAVVIAGDRSAAAGPVAAGPAAGTRTAKVVRLSSWSTPTVPPWTTVRARAS